MSPWHGASSSCGWSRRPPETKGRCEKKKRWSYSLWVERELHRQWTSNASLCYNGHMLCGSCHGMALPRVADGGDGLQIWKAAANIMNKLLQTATEGLSYSLQVWQGTISP